MTWTPHWPTDLAGCAGAVLGVPVVVLAKGPSPATKPVIHSAPLTTEEEQLSRLRVLVVDDEPHVREVLGELLEALGHTVVVTASGREAVSAVSETSQVFDLAIVDWHMPGISGRDVIHDLGHRSPNTCVVVTTGEIVATIHPGGGTAPWSAVLQKPFSLRAVKSLLDQVVPYKARADPG